jgi:hypothetical protein
MECVLQHHFIFDVAISQQHPLPTHFDEDSLAIESTAAGPFDVDHGPGALGPGQFTQPVEDRMNQLLANALSTTLRLDEDADYRRHLGSHFEERPNHPDQINFIVGKNGLPPYAPAPPVGVQSRAR